MDTYLVRSHVYEARSVVENYGNIRMITVKSNSTGEKIEIHPNFNFNLRTQTSFIENSCDVGIGKVMRDNRTEFAAAVRNCGNKNKLSISFIAHLSSISHDPFLVKLQDVNLPSPVYKAMFYEYFYSYNNSNEDDIYYASLDFPKLKTDGYNFHSLDFAMDVFNFDQVS